MTYKKFKLIKLSRNISEFNKTAIKHNEKKIINLQTKQEFMSVYVYIYVTLPLIKGKYDMESY